MYQVTFKNSVYCSILNGLNYPVVIIFLIESRSVLVDTNAFCTNYLDKANHGTV